METYDLHPTTSLHASRKGKGEGGELVGPIRRLTETPNRMSHAFRHTFFRHLLDASTITVRVDALRLIVLVWYAFRQVGENRYSYSCVLYVLRKPGYRVLLLRQEIAYVCAVRMYVCLRWHTSWFSFDFYRSFGDAVWVVIGCLLFTCLLVVDAYVHAFTSHLPSDRSRVMVALERG